MAQLMPLPLTVSCFSKVQIGLTFLVPAHLGSPDKGPLNRCLLLTVVFPENARKYQNVFNKYNLSAHRLTWQDKEPSTSRNDRLWYLCRGQEPCNLARLRQVDSRLCWVHSCWLVNTSKRCVHVGRQLTQNTHALIIKHHLALTAANH